MIFLGGQYFLFDYQITKKKIRADTASGDGQVDVIRPYGYFPLSLSTVSCLRSPTFTCWRLPPYEYICPSLVSVWQYGTWKKGKPVKTNGFREASNRESACLWLGGSEIRQKNMTNDDDDIEANTTYVTLDCDKFFEGTWADSDR